jgi:hypothetical protein
VPRFDSNCPRAHAFSKACKLVDGFALHLEGDERSRNLTISRIAIQ